MLVKGEFLNKCKEIFSKSVFKYEFGELEALNVTTPFGNCLVALCDDIRFFSPASFRAKIYLSSDREALALLAVCRSDPASFRSFLLYRAEEGVDLCVAFALLSFYEQLLSQPLSKKAASLDYSKDL